MHTELIKNNIFQGIYFISIDKYSFVLYNTCIEFLGGHFNEKNY